MGLTSTIYRLCLGLRVDRVYWGLIKIGFRVYGLSAELISWLFAGLQLESKVSDSKAGSHLKLQRDYHSDLGYVPFLMAKECEEKGSAVWKGVRTRPEQGFLKV